MPKDAPPNGGALPELAPMGTVGRVSGMQAKLHRWAVADSGRRFDDLFNLVHDPTTLQMAFERVAGNTGARSPGVDGLTAADVEADIGVSRFLDDLRATLKDGSFRPLPVRQRRSPSGTLPVPVLPQGGAAAALHRPVSPVIGSPTATSTRGPSSPAGPPGSGTSQMCPPRSETYATPAVPSTARPIAS